MLVAFGGALGAVLRYLVVGLASAASWQPWGTWVVNVIGCFAIGSIVEIYSDKPWFDEWARPVVVIGLLGGFTTFSAFSLDAVNLLNSPKYMTGVFYIIASVVSCLLGTLVGMRIFGD